ncbi:hypothetical protein DYB30_006421 [Aphanomyces astaci]|uniref:Cysteine/serine-rich nuclear protein N-terminal domain-containing protein n=1 Tax=Aphanomyces astaci TaxID=112090 RepID=A0A397DWE7_APHAT|nr:hypothetical protein DYB30_006421 [Aphanomyces astaci]RHY71851.1 hypothetical protein DYB38_009076 [Aphanomyces astaci]RHY81992.1 hypothetical protein DYB26_011054 [Aphanomyces astaci]RHZ40028.1 hypothetical protein DYB31_006770 [Aphanomyces astaci]
MTKRLAFTTATIYVFDLDHGGSALPADTGPPVGLARRHSRQERIDLTSPVSWATKRSRVRKFDHNERMNLLKAANYSMKEIAAFCFDAIDIRKSRLATLDEIEAKRQARRRKLIHNARRLPQHTADDCPLEQDTKT